MPLQLPRVLALLLVSGLAVSCHKSQASLVTADVRRSQWTVLVFMNGDNDLEEYALRDLWEMVQVGSSPEVQLVVQLDRRGQFGEDELKWSQTLRFHVTRDLKPIPEAARMDLGEVNMGSPRALEDFVTWGMATFPADRYALIIWDHGQGYRLLTPADVDPKALPGDAGTRTEARRVIINRSSDEAPHRSVSYDATSDDELYNAETSRALTAALSAMPEGGRLEVLGFDACLMSMVETAYAFRAFAHVLVGSEDLEPANGWQYDDWLAQLSKNPSMKGPDLGRLLVESYQRRYTQPPPNLNADPTTTLSAIDLERMDVVAKAVSSLAVELKRALPGELARIQAARGQCRNFAPKTEGARDEFFHVDFIHFCEQLLASDVNPAVKAAAREALGRTREAVIASYAGPKRQAGFGTSGLAIYFPSGQRDYRRDRYVRGGYEKGNKYHPVAFVHEQQWADFLHAYFEVTP